MTQSETQARWNRRYVEGDVPWDSGLPSRELARVLDEEEIPRGRAAELGCGSGTNAVYLAKRGFDVTAFDVSAVALNAARQKAAEEGVSVDFIEADLSRIEGDFEPFDFLFDRGCYHCLRRDGKLSGFLDTLRRLTRPGTIDLLLAGNANEQTEGPPRVHDHEIRADLEPLFEIRWIREFRFQDPGGVEGPLGWSCLLVRRG